ncbi:hypothetical protein OS493_004528 [Desmophyllum pertusum]|uniref:G-protein coupled receptors family 1 profile domain-containing protein n=1 Tax=Desmophyllum pertusum TaxID=174260 RepID=A0A9X0CZ61_9CNID|nr:hypothetical protein OS493_004528 [Desmophyllum pertusum]
MNVSHLMASLSPCNTTCMENSSSNETEPEYEDSFLPSPLIVLLSTICLLIIAVNGLVIFLIYKKKTLRTLTNMFLTSLALSDLMSGLVGIPLLLICFTREIINVCVSSVIFIRFTAISSVCHVLLIACDRYIFIVHYMNYHVVVTKRRAIITTVTIWLFSFVASVIQLSWHRLEEEALTEFEDKAEEIDIKYSLACIVLFFAVPLLLMCYIYGHVFYISYKRKKRDRQLKKNLQQPSRSLLHAWRGRSVLLITMVIFAGCWLPFFVMMLDDHRETKQLPEMPVWVHRLLVFVSFIPPMLNPILCTLAKKDFRQALKEVVFRRSPPHQYADGNVHFQVRKRLATCEL